MLKATFTILCTFFLFTFLMAQDFGDVNNAELKMTKFDKDPDANAIYLFNKEDLLVNHQMDLEIHRHWRMKILTDAGKDYANVKILYGSDDKLKDLQAISYAPNGDKYELDDDDIITVENKNTNSVSFAIPGVVVGSVIEVEYKIYSPYITSIDPWYFQDEVYTKLNELTIIIPPSLTYSGLKMNMDKYDIAETSEYVPDPEDPVEKVARYKWTAKDIPGLKDEPFVYNIDDKYAKIIFIVEGYKNYYQREINLSKSWNDIAKGMAKFYGDYITDDFDFNDKILSIAKENPDPLSKAEQLYNYVREEIKSTYDHGIYSSDLNTADKLLLNKSGTPSEKNILLIDILNKAGLNAKPVFISTRDNGSFITKFHNPDQFNRIICLLKISGKSYFLDTGIKSNPFGYLTPAVSVSEGLVLNDEQASIIKIMPKKSLNITSITTDAQINQDGAINAKTLIKYEGIPAVIKREKLEDQDLKKYFKEYIQDLFKDAVVDTFFITDLDSINKPLVVNLEYSIPNFTNQVDSLVYFKAPFLTAITKNPFVKDKRFFSIDYSYRSTTSEELKIHPPSNMQIDEVPLGGSFSIKGEFNFSRININADNQILCDRAVNIYKRSIPYTDYDKLKNIYDNMVKTDQIQMVLSKFHSTSK